MFRGLQTPDDSPLNIPVAPSSVAGLAWPAMPQMDGAMLLAILEQIDESQWFPADTLRDLQNLQLRGLIGHARETVPWYREHLPQPPDDQPFNEYWQELPVLSRERISNEPALFHSDTAPEAHGELTEVMTSGSTGIPLTVRRTALFSLMDAAQVMRQHRWHNRDYMGRLAKLYAQTEIRREHGPEEEQVDWGWPVTAIYDTGRAVELEIYRPVAEQVAWLRRKQPAVLVTAPTNLNLLAEYCLENGVTLSSLKSVSTIWEIVTPELRALCRQAFGVPIVDLYSCREAGALACQCPHHDHYHVSAENVLLEVLNEDGQACGPGETGQVVITPLHNFAMPLLRYAIGDYAEVGEPCSCGRGLPVLKRIQGRVRNLIKLPGGEKRWARMGRPLIREIAGGIRQYQFVQTALDTIEMRFVADAPLSPGEQDALTALFRDRTGYPFTIVFRQLEQLPMPTGGKWEDFRCEI